MIGKRRLIVCAAILVCLAVVSGMGFAATMLSPARGEQESGPSPNYHLTGQSWEAEGVLTGPGYRLGTAITGTGTPCCCVYLPCTLRQLP